MKQRLCSAFVLIVSVVWLIGCGNKGIANDIISISQYKGLEVSELTSGGELDNEYKEKVWNALLTNCYVQEYPKEELETLVDELKTQYSYVSYYSDKDAEKLIEEAQGMTVEEFAEVQLKKKYAVELIAEKEKMILTEEKYQDKLEELALTNGIESPEEYEQMFGYEELYERFQEEMVLEFLIENLK